jgi:serine/threonine protein kinase
MSPEQARGVQVDKRADIWAFGCVLFEMLTGRLAFDPGATVSDAIAAILKSEPEWAVLPPMTPVGIRKLLHRCLQKDPRERMRDAGRHSPRDRRRPTSGWNRLPRSGRRDPS